MIYTLIFISIFIVLISLTNIALLGEIVNIRADISIIKDVVTRDSAKKLASILIQEGYVTNPEKPLDNEDDIKKVIKGII